MLFRSDKDDEEAEFYLYMNHISKLIKEPSQMDGYEKELYEFIQNNQPVKPLEFVTKITGEMDISKISVLPQGKVILETYKKLILKGACCVC